MNKRVFAAVRYFSNDGKRFEMNGLPEVFSTIGNAKKFASKYADKYGKEVFVDKDCYDFAYRITWHTDADTWLRITVFGRNLNAAY